MILRKSINSEINKNLWFVIMLFDLLVGLCWVLGLHFRVALVLGTLLSVHVQKIWGSCLHRVFISKLVKRLIEHIRKYLAVSHSVCSLAFHFGFYCGLYIWLPCHVEILYLGFFLQMHFLELGDLEVKSWVILPKLCRLWNLIESVLEF